MANKSASIKAIELTRSVFEAVQGDLGLLKFSIESLTPKNGDATHESQKWEIVCTYYESLSSSSPSRFKALVDLNSNSVSIEKIDGVRSKIEGAYRMVKEESQPGAQNPPAATL